MSADPGPEGASGSMRHNILLTDPYHPVVQETVSSLKALEFVGHVFGASEEPARLCPPALSEVFPVPRPDAEDYAHQLLSAAAKAEARVVLPWSDSDARALAPHAVLFRAAGHALVCLDPDNVLLCSDQWKTLQALDAASIAVPRSLLACGARAAEACAADLGHPLRDLYVKLRVSAGGRGVWKVSRDAGLTHDEAVPALPLSAMCALIDCNVPPEGVVVQEAIAGGTDVTADVFAVAGKVISATYRERWKSTAGVSAEGMIAPVPQDVAHVIRKVCRALQWDGLGNIQMMRRPEGDTVVYEINPRAAGSIGLTRHAGFDFLDGVLRHVLGLNEGTTLAAEPVVPTVFRRDWSTQARCP
jgi:glutathione synthase/RimK-type ligase-like ATP-grasp enzyme